MYIFGKLSNGSKYKYLVELYGFEIPHKKYVKQ